MKKFLRVMVYEYSRHALRRRFLFVLLSVPLLIGVSILISALVAASKNNHLPLGYVDHSGLLSSPLPLPRELVSGRMIQIVPFTSEAQANRALQENTIQAFYVLEADYRSTRQARLVARKELATEAQQQFKDFLRVNLLRGQPPEVIDRFIRGDDLMVRSPDGRRQMGGDDWFNILVPFFAGFVFMMSIFTVSGYLMQAVVEEKENRTMEVLVTSVSPLQLMAGKVVGIIGVGLTQLLTWTGVAVAAVLIGRRSVEWLNGVRLAPGNLGIMVASMLPAFVMIAALMAAVGSTVTEASEGQQISGLFTLPVVIPYMFAAQIVSNPNGPLAVALSFFPLTAPVVLPFRLAFADIPEVQMAGNLALLILAALGSLWLAGRAFRLGMLQYGRRLSLRQIFSRAE